MSGARSGAVVGAAALAAAVWAVPARAEQARQTVHGGALAVTAGDVAFPGASLTGAAQSLQATAGEWVAKDARGTGSGWSVTIAGSGALVSAAGAVETTPRTIALSALTIDPGAVTAKPGSDPATNVAAHALTLTAGAQTLVECSAVCKGQYLFTPTFSLGVPANAYRSNYGGVVEGSALNPYRVTITLTIS